MPAVWPLCAFLLRHFRALSEEHLYQERGNRRRYFILAGDHGGKRPRFDLRLISLGSPFDYTPAAALTRAQQEGGYILWRGEAVKEYGNPMASWLAPDGSGVFIYGFGVAAPANR
ncbi:MAG: hypothetical protein HY057_11730 [Rhodospirillales bacterium]|nr:hypothetical protein [Rhodospirillales bacterium]